MELDELDEIVQNGAKYERGCDPLVIRPEDNPLFWMPFNINAAWLANSNVLLMSEAQRSRYIYLLAEAWKNGGALDSDPVVLYKLSRATGSLKRFLAELDQLMMPFDILGPDGDGVIVHPVLKRLFQDRLAQYDQRRRAGQNSGETRQKKKDVSTSN